MAGDSWGSLNAVVVLSGVFIYYNCITPTMETLQNSRDMCRDRRQS